MGTIKAVWFGNGTASYCWRIDGIAKHMNTETPHAIYVTDWTKWNKKLTEGTNLVIVELLTSPEMIDDCHEQGAKVIWEADDAFIDTYGKKERKNLTNAEGKFREKTIETIAKCDALTVTNEELKANYARFTDKPIYVLPNYVDFNWYGHGKLNIERTTDEVRIGWFGSQGHLEDLQMVIPALKTILEKYPNTRFIYEGFGGMSSDRLVTEAGWGEDIFKALPRGRREYVVGVREDYWPMKHRTLDLDIGISPLIDDAFNRCKTPIKWMEYSVLETPSVCSPTLYEDVIEHSKTGFIAKSVNDWVKYLSLLIENVSMRKKIGIKARAAVEKKYDLNNHWQKWENVYKKVLNA